MSEARQEISVPLECTPMLQTRPTACQTPSSESNTFCIQLRLARPLGCAQLKAQAIKYFSSSPYTRESKSQRRRFTVKWREMLDDGVIMSHTVNLKTMSGSSSINSRDKDRERMQFEWLMIGWRARSAPQIKSIVLTKYPYVRFFARLLIEKDVRSGVKSTPKATTTRCMRSHARPFRDVASGVHHFIVVFCDRSATNSIWIHPTVGNRNLTRPPSYHRKHKQKANFRTVFISCFITFCIVHYFILNITAKPSQQHAPLLQLHDLLSFLPRYSPFCSLPMAMYTKTQNFFAHKSDRKMAEWHHSLVLGRHTIRYRKENRWMERCRKRCRNSSAEMQRSNCLRTCA